VFLWFLVCVHRLSTILTVNLSPVSTTLEANNDKQINSLATPVIEQRTLIKVHLSKKVAPRCTFCDDRRLTLSCEYLRGFSQKIEKMALMGFSGAPGESWFSKKHENLVTLSFYAPVLDIKFSVMCIVHIVFFSFMYYTACREFTV